jgi:hypothetical protein
VTRDEKALRKHLLMRTDGMKKCRYVDGCMPYIGSYGALLGGFNHCDWDAVPGEKFCPLHLRQQGAKHG